MANTKKSTKAKKHSKLEVADIPTGVVFVLIGAALAILMVILIQVHTPKEKIQLCNDGWSRQEENGRIYETYIPENDTCKQRSDSK